MKGKFKIHGIVQALSLSSFLQRRLGAASIILDRIAELGAHDSFLGYGGRNSGNVVFLFELRQPDRVNKRRGKSKSDPGSSVSVGCPNRIPAAPALAFQELFRGGKGGRRLATGDSRKRLLRSRWLSRVRRRSDGEERWRWRREEKRSSATKYESWRAGLGKRKIARQSIILSTGNNLLGGRLLRAPPLQTWVRRAARVQAGYRGGHQGER